MGYVSLISAFPTKLRLRFFRSDPEELAAVDPLLRQVLPLTKKRGGVHSLNTAQVGCWDGVITRSWDGRWIVQMGTFDGFMMLFAESFFRMLLQVNFAGCTLDV